MIKCLKSGMSIYLLGVLVFGGCKLLGADVSKALNEPHVKAAMECSDKCLTCHLGEEGEIE